MMIQQQQHSIRLRGSAASLARMPELYARSILQSMFGCAVEKLVSAG